MTDQEEYWWIWDGLRWVVGLRLHNDRVQDDWLFMGDEFGGKLPKGWILGCRIEPPKEEKP